MLKALILDCSKDSAMAIAQKVKEAIARFDYRIQIELVTANSNTLIEHVEKTKGVYMIFIGLGLYQTTYNGFEIAKRIRERDKESYVVFAAENTGLAHLAMQGFIRPSGFLTKPLNLQETQLVISDIYRDYMNATDNSSALSVNIGTDIFFVDYKEILYFESMQKKIYLFTANQRIAYYDSLTSLENRLDERFIRCHKSFIINADKINSILFSNMRIYMENGAEIVISRTYKNALKEKLSLTE